MQTELYAFQGDADGCKPNATLLSANGMLYGSTYGEGLSSSTAFMFDPAIGKETVLHIFPKRDTGPNTPFILVGDKLYGTTSLGGRAHLGSLISLDLTTGHVVTVYSFTGETDGDSPSSALLHLNGVFYGTSSLNYAFDKQLFGFSK